MRPSTDRTPRLTSLTRARPAVLYSRSITLIRERNPGDSFMSRGPGQIEQARYAALSERGKSEKVHYGSRFILRIPVQFMAGRSNPSLRS
jgi:hypothetical protein